MATTSTNLYGVSPQMQRKLDITSRSKKKFGFPFPLGSKKGAGDYNKESGITLLKNNVQQLLQTTKGERVMFSTYGINLRQFLFEPLTQELFIQIKNEIEVTMSKFAPEIKIVKLKITEADQINVDGGMGLRVVLDLLATELNNTIFTVGVTVL
jgi:phage baseplate assembly protein W